MGLQSESEGKAYAIVLTHALAEVADELRSIDLVDLVSFIRFENFGALDDLLQSSTELLFREGSLAFGWTAGVDMRWGEMPVVTLGMEFRHQTVSMFFNLHLEAATQAVDVAWALFDPACHDSEVRLRRLIEALADAHLPKRRVAVPASRRLSLR